jgi:hypothetical protein
MEDNWQKDTRTAKEKSEQDAIERKKDQKNELRRIENVKHGMYELPLGEGDPVDQEEQLETTDRQTGLMDDIDAEEFEEESDAETDEEERPGKRRRRLEGGPITFGGKKKRVVKK